jgi:hypothetical protein
MESLNILLLNVKQAGLSRATLEISYSCSDCRTVCRSIKVSEKADLSRLVVDKHGI